MTPLPNEQVDGANPRLALPRHSAKNCALWSLRGSPYGVSWRFRIKRNRVNMVSRVL